MKIVAIGYKKIEENYRLVLVLKLLDPDPKTYIIYGSGSMKANNIPVRIQLDPDQQHCFGQPKYSYNDLKCSEIVTQYRYRGTYCFYKLVLSNRLLLLFEYFNTKSKFACMIPYKKGIRYMEG